MSAPPGMNLVLSEKWLMDYAMKQQVRTLRSARWMLPTATWSCSGV